ncbi:hypothetical protein F9U64_10855 [Gracilibacillus oryzae]|uniref:Phosphatidate cytidylyltransferase n=1 Tax=Gracilibacillus oryzae TaxID=1672701 RepID=A0A7C8GT77_9BACI|nr:hypothetical protein [Gracilibacillus oryzae]KAB8135762.1 hypothetical protein F9U64_10855 [Gracilibacillus oryzae]
MSNKLYYIVITPMIIIGLPIIYYYPGSYTYVLLALVTAATYFSAKDTREKLKKAEGEEEIRQAIVPMILIAIVFILAIVSLVF